MAAIVGIVFAFHDLGFWERSIIRKYHDDDPIIYLVGSGEESTCRAPFGAKDLHDLIGCVTASIALDGSGKP